MPFARFAPLFGLLRAALLNRYAHGVAPLVDWLVRRTAHPAAIGRDVLMVRLDAIGDFLLWLDAAQRLAAHYRGDGRRVTLLANAPWAELAERSGAFDAVWRLDRRRFQRNPVYRFRLMRRIRKAGFEAAVQPTYSRELLLGDAAVRMGGWRRRVGSTGDLSNQKEKERRRANVWYTELIPARPGPLSELERNAEFVRGLGLPAEPRIGRLPGLPTVPRTDIFVLFPGASLPVKCWPATAFARLAERIAETTGWQGVLAGGPGDRAASQAVQAATSLPLIDRVGHTTLGELALLLQGARLLVANDTSAIHLAAVVGTPSVCILGGGHYGRFLPYPEGAGAAAPRAVASPMPCFGCNWRCRLAHRSGDPFPCVAGVGLDAVWQAVEPLLASELSS